MADVTDGSTKDQKERMTEAAAQIIETTRKAWSLK
jgi:hypothetical protein